MKRILLIFAAVWLIVQPVRALDYTAPEAPDSAQQWMPAESGTFAADLWTVITGAVSALQPSLAEAAAGCIALVAMAMLISILNSIPGKAASVADLVGVLGASLLLLQQTKSMIALATDTVTQLSEYSKLLLPVMAAALASQGAVTSSAAMYGATAAFDALLSSGISSLLVPMVYVFLILSIGAAATGEGMLQKLKDFMKWLVTWCLKTVLYIFTGYIGITGVVSGTTDAATLKATKLTMSGMIPVVGSILADASEAVIVSAGVMKNAVGVYGLVAFIAIWISPFLKIGVQYLLLKLTGVLCEVFQVKAISQIIKDFATAMGILLGMTGAVCVFLLISTVCFMKGVS